MCFLFLQLCETDPSQAPTGSNSFISTGERLMTGALNTPWPGPSILLRYKLTRHAHTVSHYREVISALNLEEINKSPSPPLYTSSKRNLTERPVTGSEMTGSLHFLNLINHSFLADLFPVFPAPSGALEHQICKLR